VNPLGSKAYQQGFGKPEYLPGLAEPCRDLHGSVLLRALRGKA
jgi:hypothetical protein